jgi:hypothetical protein
MCYLVEQYAKDDFLYPKDPKKRSLVNERLYFDATTLYQRFINYFVSKVNGSALNLSYLLSSHNVITVKR